MLTFEEKTMIPIIDRNHGKLIEATFGHAWQDSAVMDEIDSGYGIADLVIFQPPAASLQNVRRTVFLDNEDQVRTLFVVNDKQIFSITDLSEQLCFSKARLKNQLRFLQEAGFVSEIGGGTYRVVSTYSAGVHDSIAVEAKIRDWRRGLYQAYRYKWFSNASYLAVHHKFVDAAKNNIDEFIRLNVGLAEVFDEKIRVIHKPTPERPMSPVIRALAYEQILARSSY